MKNIKPQAMKERKQTHQKLFKRLISPIHYQRVLTKRLQMGYKKLAQELTMNKT